MGTGVSRFPTSIPVVALGFLYRELAILTCVGQDSIFIAFSHELVRNFRSQLSIVRMSHESISWRKFNHDRMQLPVIAVEASCVAAKS